MYHKIPNRYFGSVICTLLLALTILASLSAQDASYLGGLGQQVAGTYLLDVTIEGTPPPGLPQSFLCLLALTENGQAAGDCAVTPPGRDLSAFYGVWRRLQGDGGRGFEILVFQFDTHEDAFMLPDGMHLGTARNLWSVQFDAGFQGFEGTFVNEVFASVQDPLTAQDPIGVIVGTTTARRVRIGDQ